MQLGPGTAFLACARLIIPFALFISDLLQAMAAVSNHIPHKVLGDNQRGKEAVRRELPRIVG